MAEERTENADVVAATVAYTKHRLFIELIGSSKPRSEVVAVLDATIERIVAYPRDENLTGVQIEETAVAGLIHGLRVNHIQPQSVVEGQLRRDAPGVLAVVEVTPLPLCGICFRADVATELGHVAEEEGSQAEPSAAANSAVASNMTCRVRFGLNESSPERCAIARHAQVDRAAHVDTKLEGVIAEQLREVVTT